MSEPSTVNEPDPVLRLHAGDEVGIARRDIAQGQGVPFDGSRIVAIDAIPAGHKIALVAIPMGAPVRKYGQVIGRATAAIDAGSHVHTHNLSMYDFTRSSASAGVPPSTPVEHRGATFQGIVRADGRVGTRNYIGILTTVNCSATAARRIADQMTLSGELDDYPNVDGVVALTHKTGCGMALDGIGLAVLRRTLSGYAAHPNFAALVVLGLGCEVNQIDALTRTFDLPADTPVHSLTIQHLGGTKNTVARGIELIRELLPMANESARSTVPASRLILGLQCGGSDGFSGITANPALGYASDLLVGNGGTSILSETPEIYGAEHLLASRAVSPAVAQRLADRISWWEAYTATNGGTMDNNPSPGNKQGGLSTILEKSLGATAKGGMSPLEWVYEYGEHVDRPGLVFMDTPGFDPVSVTGQVAGGATIVCFTTGRGSAFGCKPVPSIKLATNTPIFERMRDDMDLDCGGILDGHATVSEVGSKIFRLILETASGRPTKSEELGYGAEEFNPWHIGSVM